MRLTVDAKLESPKLRDYIARLMEHARHDLNARAAKSVERLTRAHLNRFAGSHHGTAQKLGAKPTGHLEKAARNINAAADGAGFSVFIESPGIRRARGAFDIVPREKSALTIPLHALAYGNRVSDLRENGMVIFRPKRKGGGKANILATKEKDGKLLALYALVKRARIPHEPDLLPTDDEIKHAAKVGIAAFIRRREGRE